jgi:hypothetical protein
MKSNKWSLKMKILAKNLEIHKKVAKNQIKNSHGVIKKKNTNRLMLNQVNPISIITAKYYFISH